jgi:TetR/AcrR family transcriptional repressor of nem operon
VPRPRTFDLDQALDRALEVFWCRGYEATSVRDLTEALGVGQGSLYAAFGSKDALYRSALERYVDRQGAQLLAALETEEELRPVLRRALIGLAEADLADPGRRGCLLVNAATERAADEATGRQVAAALSAVETALRSALRRAQLRGEIKPEKDPAQIARLLTTFIQGLRVMGKARASRAFVTDAIEGALGALD